MTNATLAAWYEEWPGKGHLSFASLEEMIHDFERHRRPGADAELATFADEPSLQAAVRRAALAVGSDGKRSSHQRRIPADVLRECHARLAGIDFSSLHNFDELILLLEETIRPICGVGELLVYDTALRIGAYLGLEPEVVYLHAGTRKGARALGLKTKRAWLAVDELPDALRALKPREIEDCLCIYKRWLGLLV